jgi:hypothetical protein
MNKVVRRIAGTIRARVTIRVLKTAAFFAEKRRSRRWCMG